MLETCSSLLLCPAPPPAQRSTPSPSPSSLTTSVLGGGGEEGRVQPTVIPSQGDWPPEVSRALWEGADSLPASQSQAREPKPISMDSGLPHPNR
jgi:hypothetical protein